MVFIKNDNVRIEAAPSGQIYAKDLKRGANWRLEECSLLYGWNILKNEFTNQAAVRELKSMAVKHAALINDNEMQVFLDAGGAEISYVYSLLPDGFEVRLKLNNTDGIETFSMPGSFTPENGGKKLILPVMQGMLWDGRGEDVGDICANGGHGGFSMQMYGVLSDKGGLLCAAEESVDSRWRYIKDGDGKGNPNR